MKRKVLLIDDGGTQILPMAKSIYNLGYEVHIIYCSKLTYGYPTRFVKKRYFFNKMKNIDAFGSYLVTLMSTIQFETVIPLDDDSAKVISIYKVELQKYCKLVVPSYDTFRRGYDKTQLMELCQQKGYPHPPTMIVRNGIIPDSILKELLFPILIKPNDTSGGRGMTLVNSAYELLSAYPKIYEKYGDCHLQSYIPQGGAQVKVQLFINEKKELVQSSVIRKYRWYPENGGSSCCNVSCINDNIVEICYNILKDIGWIGFADFDTIQDPRTGELLVIEINPRIPACIKTAFAAGVDWGNVIVSECLCLKHPSYYLKENVYLRHLGMDTLWFYNSKRRFSTKPSWFNFIGRNIYYQDISCWTDPLPFLFGTIGNFKKQFSREFRLSKSGTSKKITDSSYRIE